ncbi:MAG: hypothetical protein Q4A74_09765 [Cardiobacteriaceae bacterium]|nr:hypothetical protein [Cardiobacteriaceae bacterium]
MFTVSAAQLRDAQDVRFTSKHNGSSTYHLYGAHLAELQAPYGLLVYLHGDGAGEFSDPLDSSIKDYARVARQYGLLMIAPRTPDRKYQTWWHEESSPRYLRELLQDLYSRYPINRKRIWFVGYSGGAETLSYNILTDDNDLFDGGGVLFLGGGGFDNKTTFSRAPKKALKAHFYLHWLVGADDSPTKGGADHGFNALAAAQKGYQRYTSAGFMTKITILPHVDHYRVCAYGAVSLAEMLERASRSAQ